MLKTIFKDGLPNNPYCADSFDYGVQILTKELAITKRHIQPNSPIASTWLVLDLDSPDFWYLLESRFLPTPNFVVFNPENNHCHIFYGLKTPVYRAEAAREKPLRYLASIEYALREAWSADYGYSGLISKNPLHEHWDTKELRTELWDLGELADWLTLPAKIPKKGQQVGLGRNCTLFEWLRYWAYESVIDFRLTKGRNEWERVSLAQAEAFNTFPEPLPYGEVKSIAKSVAEWVWRKYTKRLSDEEFSKRQALRGKQGGLAKGRVNAGKRTEALKMRADGVTYKEISKVLDVPYSTVGRWCKDEKSH